MALKSPWIAAFLLAAAIALGGGGSLAPKAEMALQLVFAATLAAAVLWPRPAQPGEPEDSGIDRRAWLLAALVLALPIIQLVPLPPSLWQALPGREREVAALALVGAENAWMPWSQTPSRTLAALLAMLPPVVLFLFAVRLGRRGRSLLLATVVVGCLASIGLGALQLASGEGTEWRLYANTHLTWLTGFQSNRNAQADMLIAGILALAAVHAAGPRGDGSEYGERRGLGAGAAVIGVLLLLGAVLTGSRMGIALLALALPLALLIVWQGNPLRARLPGPALLALGVAGLAVLAVGLLQLPAVSRVADRFLNDGDSRALIWDDTRVALAQAWPAGTGLGSFEPVFAASESLENVTTRYQARAHNDWLEFALETGLPGLAVLGVIIVVLAALAVRGLLARARGALDRVEAAQLLAGSGILLVIALHSLVDYPLRSISLACVAAVAAAMHFPLMTSMRPSGGRAPTRGPS